MLEWLTSIPGILISCGVLLLIISVIIFIATSKKGETEPVKEEVKEEKPVAIEEVKVEEPKEEVNFEPVVEIKEEVVEVPVETEEETIEIEIPVEEEPKMDYSFTEVQQEAKPTVYGGFNPLDNIKRNVVEPTEPEVKVDTLDE